jgi:hypothetical protein
VVNGDTTPLPSARTGFNGVFAPPACQHRAPGLCAGLDAQTPKAPGAPLLAPGLLHRGGGLRRSGRLAR